MRTWLWSALALLATATTDAEQQEVAASKPARPRLPISKAWLVVHRSVIPQAGLGVFLSNASTVVVKPGVVVTTHGNRLMVATEAEAAGMIPYAASIPNSNMARVGDPYTGELGAMIGADEPVGHMINDGTVVGLHQGHTIDDVEEVVRQYYKESIRKANVMFTPDAFNTSSYEMWAIKDIRPGDELYMTYGAPFWMNFYLNRSPDPLIRLVVYSFMTTNDPKAFSKGFVTYDRHEHKLRHSKTKREPTEKWCTNFLNKFLTFQDEKSQASLLVQYGMKDMTSDRERLAEIFKIATVGRVAYNEEMKQKKAEQEYRLSKDQEDDEEDDWKEEEVEVGANARARFATSF